MTPGISGQETAKEVPWGDRSAKLFELPLEGRELSSNKDSSYGRFRDGVPVVGEDAQAAAVVAVSRATRSLSQVRGQVSQVSAGRSV